jgi:hypothetical protein
MSRNIATKVTDMMADWARKDADAQAEAVTRLGLPANNTASDRAKAMGFDIDSPEYHTTDLEGRLGIEADGFKNYDKQKNFSNLDEAMKKSGASDRDRYLTLDDLKESDFDADGNIIGFENDALRSYNAKGNYTSDEPFISEMTAQVSPLDSRYTFPLVVNKSKHFDYTNPEHVKDLMTPRPDKSTWSDMFPDEFGTGEVNPLDLERIQKGQHNVMEDFITQMNMKKRGYTGTNMKEPESYVGNRATTTVTFKPELFRSPLAHFNPKMAGIGGAGAVMSNNLMADELDLEYKGQEPSTWDSLMNTIGNVNQEQAQAYGDTGAGAMNIAHMLATDPAVAGEVISTVGLKGVGAVSPYIKGFGVGLLLDSDEASASPKYSDEDFIKKLEGR